MEVFTRLSSSREGKKISEAAESDGSLRYSGTGGNEKH